MSRVVAIIQARLGSTRLPQKALVDIGGRPLIAHVIERVRRMAGLSHVVVATPSYLESMNIGIGVLGVGPVSFWGDVGIAESDVLGRYAECARSEKADIIVRVTADCPLWDPHQGERVLALYRDAKVQYASNIANGYRDGEDVEVFSVEALKAAHNHAFSAHDREHVTPWMRRNCSIATLPPSEIRSDVKTSVDTKEDLERVRAMVAG